VAIIRAESEDCDQLAEQYATVGWHLAVQQLDSGTFRGRFVSWKIGDLDVYLEYYNRALVMYGAPPPGLVPIFLPRARGSAGNFEGSRMSERSLFIGIADSDGLYVTPDDLETVTICIPLARLTGALELFCPEVAEKEMYGAKTYDRSPELLGRLRSKIVETRQYAEQHAGKAVVGGSELEDRLLLDFCLTLSSGRGRQWSDVPGRERYRYARLAREYIETNRDESITMAALCKVVGVSIRTLEYSFRDVFEMTPIQFIRKRRLNAVRSALLQPRNRGRKVTTVAMDHGFWHLGRFSREYRLLFHELPSETRRRSAKRIAYSPARIPI
jgi:AraC family ethanolamine operon transcriptional activator